MKRINQKKYICLGKEIVLDQAGFEENKHRPVPTLFYNPVIVVFLSKKLCGWRGKLKPTNYGVVYVDETDI